MSAAEGRTVSELLPPSFDGMDDVIEREFAERSQASSGVPSFLWKVVGEKATQAVRETLDLDIFNEIARAWSKAVELSQYADETKYPPHQTNRVFLGKHKVKRDLQPVLTVRIGSREALRLRFTLEFAAELRSAQLDIRNGHIVAIGAGDCSVSLQLKYGGHNLHPAVNSAKVPFTEARPLPEPGFPIRRKVADRSAPDYV